MAASSGTLDLLLSTVAVDLDWSAWLNLLRPTGVLTFVGVSPGPIGVTAAGLVMGQKSIRGSAIGNRSTMEEMLRFAAFHRIIAQTEIMPMIDVNAAIGRVRDNQARYRVVLVN